MLSVCILLAPELMVLIEPALASTSGEQSKRSKGKGGTKTSVSIRNRITDRDKFVDN